MDDTMNEGHWRKHDYSEFCVSPTKFYLIEKNIEIGSRLDT